MEEKKTPEEAEFKQQVAELRQWLEEKPYVPYNIEDKLYRRFVHSCYYDLEKAKTAADLFFSIRAIAPELLTNRDPLSPDMQKTAKIAKFARYRIAGNKNLWIWQLDDPGMYNFNHQLEAKRFLLLSDAWLLDDEVLQEEDIMITDLKDMSWRILTRFSFAVARKMSRYQQEAIPIRIKQIHLVNAPGVIYRVFALMKPFIKKEIMDLVHVHRPNSTTLFDYLSRDDLPEEFGGTRGKIADYVAETEATIMKHRETLIDDNFWRIDSKTSTKEKEANKPVTNTSTDINSLRTIDID